jgi:hypothetical protein
VRAGFSSDGVAATASCGVSAEKSAFNCASISPSRSSFRNRGFDYHSTDEAAFSL